MAESVYQAVDVIFRAQELDHQLRFHYFRWDLQGKQELRRNGEHYNVSPWNLIYDDEKYYSLLMKDIYEIKIIHMEPIQWVKRGVEEHYLGK